VTSLVDPHGRTVRDLRISVTDRCNFRCTYCMPEEGMTWLPRSELLSFDEIERVAGVFVKRFGIESIRLTGGEPTVRAHLPVLVGRLADLGVELSLTTNASSLAHHAAELAAAGLQRINVSCDSLRPDRFARITGRDALAQVLAGIDAALAAGLAPVKLNCVVVAGLNDDEIIDFAAFGRAKGIEVRFIEWMPLDGGGSWRADAVLSAKEIIRQIDAVWPLDQAMGRGAAPAAGFAYRDSDFAPGGGRVSVIGSVTEPFCASCDRVRLTAEGQLRNCLFSIQEADLRAVMRGGGSDDDLAAAVEAEVGRKWAGHSIGQVHFIRPARSMSQIGG
jgi:GTP 3',8-cyclase